MPKTILVDGVSLEMTDTTAQVVQRSLDTSAKALADADKAKATLTDELAAEKKKAADSVAIIATKDAEIATLKTQLKDAELTPAKLDAAVMDRAVVIDKAKKILGDKLVVKDKSVNEIRRQVVDSRLGDTAKAWNDDQVRVSFDTLAVDAKPNSGQGVTDIANAFAAPRTEAKDDSSKAYDEYCKDLEKSWQKKPVAA